MKRFKLYISLMVSVFVLMSVSTIANTLVSGACSNGRTWWANIEINSDGSVGCITGMNCNGQGYQRNCGGSGGGGGGSVTTITSSLSGSDLTVTLSATSNLKVYQVVSGNLVYTHSSTISSGVPTAVSTSSWGTGPFIIVTFDPSTNEVTGSLQISLN